MQPPLAKNSPDLGDHPLPILPLWDCADKISLCFCPTMTTSSAMRFWIQSAQTNIWRMNCERQVFGKSAADNEKWDCRLPLDSTNLHGAIIQPFAVGDMMILPSTDLAMSRA
jgi:hypothetical protein